MYLLRDSQHFPTILNVSQGDGNQTFLELLQFEDMNRKNSTPEI